MKVSFALTIPPILGILHSCALVTVPVKVTGKVITTSVGLVGKAAGAGIDAMVSDDNDDEDDDHSDSNDE